jgi:hypothetical protein
VPRGLSFGRLLLIGTGSTDYLDVLAREGWEQEVAEAGARALKGLGGWRVADLRDVRPTAAAWDIFHGWEGPRMYFRRFGSPVMDVRPWDELVTSLSKNHRSSVRRTLRRAENDRVRSKLAEPADAKEAATRWMTLHQEAWKGRNIAPEHLDERFKAHLEAAARRMMAHGLGGISEFWRDGKVIASHFLVFGRDFWAPYAGYQALRSKAELYAYSEGTPGWVKKAVAMRLILRRRRRAKSVERISK